MSRRARLALALALLALVFLPLLLLCGCAGYDVKAGVGYNGPNGEHVGTTIEFAPVASRKHFRR